MLLHSLEKRVLINSHDFVYLR